MALLVHFIFPWCSVDRLLRQYLFHMYSKYIKSYHGRRKKRILLHQYFKYRYNVVGLCSVYKVHSNEHNLHLVSTRFNQDGLFEHVICSWAVHTSSRTNNLVLWRPWKIVEHLLQYLKYRWNEIIVFIYQENIWKTWMHLLERYWNDTECLWISYH